MESKTPQEDFPTIGTNENPAIFFDGSDLLLSYDIAPVAGGGIAILKFFDVIHFEKNPINVEGLRDAKYPTNAWDFTEVCDSDRTAKWKALSPRFWTISFNDVTVEIIFSEVQIVYETRRTESPSEALVRLLTT
ncbi:hypothetical protein [Ruegeria meonggei]|uniref:hypothetical protein n=1 Tax=Ruegeria meonggei TaxID=1446476 RepID=UPI00367317DF